MRKFKSIICIALAVLLAASCFAGCTQKEEFDVKKIVMSDEQISDVKSEIDEIINSKIFYGGVSVMLNENEVYKKYFGVADANGEPVNENTHFLLNAATMAFTAVAVRQLDEDGKLSLDDNLSKYYDASNRAYLNGITVENLLDVSVSLGNFAKEMKSDGKVWKELNKKLNSKKKKSSEQVREMIEEHILGKGAVLGDNSVDAERSNYYILGRIIEKASGMGYDEYIQKNILNKLGLKNTYFLTSEQEIVGYNLETNKWVNHEDCNLICNYDYLYSSHGLVSSLDDMSKFYRAVLDKQLCKADIAAKVLKKGKGFSYGFKTDGKMLYINAGLNIHLAYVYINPETEEIINVLSCTVGGSSASELGKEIYREVNSKVNGIILENAD